jgi:hypothetical protein
MVGCGPDKPGPGAGDDDDAPTTPTTPVDPIEEALGGCTASTDDEIDQLGPWWAEERAYDDHGDVVHADVVYVDEDLDDYSVDTSYDAVHEFAQSVFTDANGVDTQRWTWQGGHIVHWEVDRGTDSVLDETEDRTYDADHIVRTEWDYDGDGDTDDFIDFAWTADGDGWLVEGTGEDPNGPYSSIETRDADLRQLTYHYEDSTGLVYDWEVFGWSQLGELTAWSMTTVAADGTTDEESHEATFDDAGRRLTEVTEFARFDPTGAPGVAYVETATTTWDCPAR